VNVQVSSGCFASSCFAFAQVKNYFVPVLSGFNFPAAPPIAPFPLVVDAAPLAGCAGNACPDSIGGWQFDDPPRHLKDIESDATSFHGKAFDMTFETPEKRSTD